MNSPLIHGVDALATLTGIIMDAFELLKNDHKKVSQLFKEIESASGQAKTQLFSRLSSLTYAVSKRTSKKVNNE